MSRAAQTALALVNGVALGTVAAFAIIIFYNSLVSWYHGGIADPRCVYNWHGYVEVHQLGGHGKPDRVACEYRPGLVPP